MKQITHTDGTVEFAAEDAPEQFPEGFAPSAGAYEQRVEAAIRARYTVSDELAILRQRDQKPEEFAAYYDFCEACKAGAKRQGHA